MAIPKLIVAKMDSTLPSHHSIIGLRRLNTKKFQKYLNKTNIKIDNYTDSVDS